MADLSVVCAASLPLTLLAAYALQPLADARRRLPPGPRPLPLIGNLLDIGKRPHRSLASLADLHGPLMFIRLGTVPAVVATSPEAARKVLQKKNASLAARRGLDAWRVMDHDANSMVALPPGGKWRAFRQHSRAALLGPRPLDEHRAVREEEVRELVRRVSAAGGAPVDVAREAFVAMVNVLCRGMFSEKLDPAVVSELAEEAAVLSGLPACPTCVRFLPGARGPRPAGYPAQGGEAARMAVYAHRRAHRAAEAQPGGRWCAQERSVGCVA